jgi:hypothetical protein
MVRGAAYWQSRRLVEYGSSPAQPRRNCPSIGGNDPRRDEYDEFAALLAHRAVAKKRP